MFIIFTTLNMKRISELDTVNNELIEGVQIEGYSDEALNKLDVENIFKRFYKGKNSINPKSIGIGLSLSKKIIEAHGGSIAVESDIGKGTNFTITLLKVIV